jgi:hypothetical protein
MFVRWKRRRLAQRDAAGLPHYSLYAVLVENHRVDGKTMQHVVRYLAYIAESDVRDPVECGRFWSRVEETLNEMGIDGETRGAIEEKLAAMVGRPGTSREQTPRSGTT